MTPRHQPPDRVHLGRAYGLCGHPWHVVAASVFVCHQPSAKQLAAPPPGPPDGSSRMIEMWAKSSGCAPGHGSLASR